MQSMLPALSLAMICAAGPAAAVESGLSPYPKGLAGFMAGIVPPQPGFYLTDTYYYLHGSANAEVRNGVAEFGAGMTLNADFLQGTYVTDATVLGGTYALSAAFAYASGSLHASLNTPTSGIDAQIGNDGWGDSIITPVILGWHEGDFHWNLGLSVYAPTGEYGPHELSLGKNIWAFMPQFGLTWFDPPSGWDASATLVYVTMTGNDATDYQSGDLLHLDWAIGKHFGEGGAFEAGIAGNVVQQIGADRGSGAKLGPFKAESLGIGPAISYSTQAGSIPISFGFKWEHDIDAHNTFSGDLLSVSVTAVF